MPHKPQRDLSTNDVAELLQSRGIRGASRPSIIRLADSGFIPHYRTPGGNYRMFRPEVVDLLVRVWRQIHDPKRQEEARDRLFALNEQLEQEESHGNNQQVNTASA